MFVMGTISQWKVFNFFSINQSASGKLELSSNQILSGLVACVYIDISYECVCKTFWIHDQLYVSLNVYSYDLLSSI